MVFASYLTTSFIIAGVGAWYLLQNKHKEIAQFCFKVGLMTAVGLSVAQIF